MTDRSDKSRSSAAKGRASDETRTMERPSVDQWAPSNVLELPPNTDEYRYRWIAEYVNGQHVPRNVQSAIREGYQRVHISELSEGFIVDEDVKGDGFARTGGLILMKLPEEFAKQREAYYLKRSVDGLRGANVLQGVAGRDAVSEDRGTRTLSGAEAGAALRNMSG